MIELIDVTHYYDVRPVLRNVTLSVDSGTRVAVLGPNGMGKSTLLGVRARVRYFWCCHYAHGRSGGSSDFIR